MVPGHDYRGNRQWRIRPIERRVQQFGDRGFVRRLRESWAQEQ
jgi:hypothetical protein